MARAGEAGENRNGEWGSEGWTGKGEGGERKRSEDGDILIRVKISLRPPAYKEKDKFNALASSEENYVRGIKIMSAG